MTTYCRQIKPLSSRVGGRDERAKSLLTSVENRINFPRNDSDSHTMSDADYLKCPCQKCGGPIEFPVSGAGDLIDCPHCGEQTKLVSSKSVGKSAIGVGLVFSVLCLVASCIWIYWRMMQKPASGPSQTQQIVTNGVISKAFTELNDFEIGKITLKKSQEGGLVYAQGTITNPTDRQRFGIKIELDLLDAQDDKIGNASDYLAVLEPHKAWRFNALLTEPKTVKAKLVNIEEQK